MSGPEGDRPRGLSTAQLGTGSAHVNLARASKHYGAVLGARARAHWTTPLLILVRSRKQRGYMQIRGANGTLTNFTCMEHLPHSTHFRKCVE